MTSLLLLSGGLDSAAIAAVFRPDVCLFVDYGQRPADGERLASRTIADELGLDWIERQVDLSSLGAGLLVGERPAPTAPTPEWFPFRNQLLVTVAGAVGILLGVDVVWIGLTVEDGARHADGRPEFVDQLDSLMRFQEGEVGAAAPAIDLSGRDLLDRAALSPRLVAATLSCHVSSMPCGQCPGCTKRRAVLGPV